MALLADATQLCSEASWVSFNAIMEFISWEGGTARLMFFATADMRGCFSCVL